MFDHETRDPAARERQQGRSAEVPKDIERRNAKSVQRSRGAHHEASKAGDTKVPDSVRDVRHHAVSMTEYNLSHVTRGPVGTLIEKIWSNKVSTKNIEEYWCSNLDRDWDNLIILDGCRYDIFAKSDYPDGQLQKEISRGSQTEEFLKKNFPSKKYPDIVYISANPNIKYLNSKFFKRVRLWENQWNNELNVVHPESVTDWVIENAEEYANKRMTVHYMHRIRDEPSGGAGEDIDLAGAAALHSEKGFRARPRSYQIKIKVDFGKHTTKTWQ
ncbi:hypothetical protein C8039_05320 [Halogeometricum sp. wsp3]|nr:hypothetical protein C8039_05320 [Halogeometricum sp. wsp3]